ncbi:hypothetical protein DAETH_11810 [Deinococcus aetherius]|uniref:SH3b domain-containing protein n=1 Tax=Deinococcus aetherius TaxID=200252 RepID=A0ABM8AC46_9DEIO|nr:DUF3761 domain-containing protein [Deinococcus aetherius]BDP41212.1 hypothetical protein DAETH_11810 [Deinococcus aetherius]
MKQLLFALALALGTQATALQVTTTNNVNLRGGPSTSARVLTVIPRGTSLNVGSCTTWCPVTYGGQKGFVSRSVLTFKAPVTPAPVPVPSNGTYTNVDGQQIQRPVFFDSVPSGASARCRDGSYSFSAHRRGTCSHHGGVATWY